MAYKWDSSLETSNAAIDNQHKQLVEMLNKLVSAYEEGRSEKELASALEFLAAYTIKHFNDEEALQKEYNYPDFIYHQRCHHEFKITVNNLIKRLNEEGYTKELMNHTIELIAGWLINHIKGDDFKLAAHIKLVHNRKGHKPCA